MASAANIRLDAAIFEACTAPPRIWQGRGVANPLALLLAAAMMLDHVNRHELAQRSRSPRYLLASYPPGLGSRTPSLPFIPCPALCPSGVLGIPGLNRIGGVAEGVVPDKTEAWPLGGP